MIAHLDILAKGVLAVIAWGSIFLGKPFVLQYARATVPLERQDSPLFYPTCRNLAIIWGVVFLLATGISLAKTYGYWTLGISLQVVSLVLILLGFSLNHYYPEYVQRRARIASNLKQLE